MNSLIQIIQFSALEELPTIASSIHQLLLAFLHSILISLTTHNTRGQRLSKSPAILALNQSNNTTVIHPHIKSTLQIRS